MSNNKNVIKFDAYDKKAFEVFLKNSQYIQKLLRHYSSELHEKLVEDTFYTFFKYVVEFNDFVDEKFNINKYILKGAISSIEYEKSKLLTELNIANSGTATILFIDKFFKNLSRLNKTSLSKISPEELEKLGNETIKDVGNEIVEVIEGLEAIKEFGRGKGDKKYLSVEEKFNLVDEIIKNKVLKEIIKKLGRLRKLAISEYKNKLQYNPEEVYSIKVGRNLKYLLPKEITYFSDEILYLEFLRKFYERKLLNYELKSRENNEKGPIIILIDHSGSMYGEREIWSKAVALSLIEIAKREKREIYYIAFDDGVRYVKKITPGKISYKELVELASLYFGGGTDFVEPLNKAVEIIMRENKSADILLITDGYAKVPKSFIDKLEKLKRELNFKLYSIFVETYPTETIISISDSYIKVKDLVDEEAKKVYKMIKF